MILTTLKARVTCILGNLLEHYDSALYGLLAPFIAPHFFGPTDAVTALIMAYAIIPLGLITKPLGSLYFGRIGDRLGRKHALMLSLMGMAIATITLGCMPSYSQIGPWSIVSLALLRMLQSFCSAGEVVGGAIFFLEHTEESKRSVMSGWYDASTIAGVLIASAFVAILCMFGSVTENWRFLFWIGGVTAILGVFLRITAEDSPEYARDKEEKKGDSLFKVLYEHRNVVFSIFLAAGFTYTTYTFAFTLINGYVPLVTSHTKDSVIYMNTWLLLIDMCMLPLFGRIGARIGKGRLMILASTFCGLGALPLFYLLDGASIAIVALIRFYIVLCGVAFGAVYYAWCVELLPPSRRYTILAIAGSLGAQAIGVPSSAICLWLYKSTLWVPAPAIYITAISLLAAFGIYRFEKKREWVPS